MVTAKFEGRIGNQCFQIAHAVALALANNDVYQFPDPKAQGGLVYFTELPRLPHNISLSTTYKEKQFNFQKVPYQRDMRIDGYWQSEKYFAHYRKEVISALGFDWTKRNDNLVSIHVRRGDYVVNHAKHPPITMDYITRAVNLFTKQGFTEFLVFSDDIPWCEENIKIAGANFIFSVGRSEKEDIRRMSECSHHVISNSTFSWWGAWLNRSPDKIVIAPKIWFGPSYAYHNTSDILPVDWIKL